MIIKPEMLRSRAAAEALFAEIAHFVYEIGEVLMLTKRPTFKYVDQRPGSRASTVYCVDGITR